MASAPAGTQVSVEHRVPNITPASTEDDQMRLISLLVNLRQNAEKTDPYGMSPPVSIAAWNNHCEEVQNLCKHGRDLNAVDQTGQTALFTAVWNGCIGCVEKLVKAGADCSIVDRYDNSPLMLAAELAYVQVTERLLLAKVEINHQNHRGETALCKAASSSYIPCLRLLLKHGADPNITDNKSCSPLFHCISRNRDPSAFVNMVLLIKSNAEMEIEGHCREVENGRALSAFELAVRLDRHMAVKLLAVAGCNLRVMRNWVDEDLVPESLKKDLALFDYLKETCAGPPQLRQTCRKVIRQHCAPNELHHLLLPSTLIDYISFKELDFVQSLFP